MPETGVGASMKVDLRTAMGESVPVILMVSSMSEMTPQPVGSATTVSPGVTKQGDGSELAVVMGFKKGSRRFLISVMSSLSLISSKHSSSVAASLARPSKRAMSARTCDGSRQVSREKYAATYSTSQDGAGRVLSNIQTLCWDGSTGLGLVHGNVRSKRPVRSGMEPRSSLGTSGENGASLRSWRLSTTVTRVSWAVCSAGRRYDSRELMMEICGKL
ncbi:hypothetical protein KCV07_g521, partial [Aureobasidium melanogenum]